MMAEQRQLIIKVVKSICLVLVWVCLGLYSEITGVTLQDLRERTGSNYETIGQAISMRMVGIIIGSVFTGWLLDKYKNLEELFVGLALTIAALVCVAIAYTPIVGLMFPEFAIQGLMETWINIAGQQSLILMWADKASGPLHAAHLGYGIGSFIVPQIAKPFLSQRIPTTSSKFSVQNCLANTTGNRSENSTAAVVGEPENNHFEYSYIIIMAIIMSFSTAYYAFFYCTRRGQSTTEDSKKEEVKKTVKEIFNFNSCSPGHPYYAAGIFALVVLWFFMTMGGHMVFASFLYSYSRDLLCLSKDSAADIQTIFWIGYTCGRAVTTIVAIWIPMKVLIFLEAGGNFASALVIFFNPENVTVIMVTSFFSGFFVGPLYPSGNAWANRYITMTGLAYTFSLVGGSAAGAIFNVVIGWCFENTGPQAFCYFVLGYSTLGCITAVGMHLFAQTRGDKYSRGEEGSHSHESCSSDEKQHNDCQELKSME